MRSAPFVRSLVQDSPVAMPFAVTGGISASVLDAAINDCAIADLGMGGPAIGDVPPRVVHRQAVPAEFFKSQRPWRKAARWLGKYPASDFRRATTDLFINPKCLRSPHSLAAQFSIKAREKLPCSIGGSSTTLLT